MFSYSKMRMYDFFGKGCRGGMAYKDFFTKDMNMFCEFICKEHNDFLVGFVECDDFPIPNKLKRRMSLFCKAAMWWPSTIRFSKPGCPVFIASMAEFKNDWNSILAIEPNPFQFDCFMCQAIGPNELVIRFSSCGHEYDAIYAELPRRIGAKKLKDFGFFPVLDRKYSDVWIPGKVCGVRR